MSEWTQYDDLHEPSDYQHLARGNYTQPVSLERWFLSKSIRQGDKAELQRAILAIKFALGVGVFTAVFSIALFAMGAVVLAAYDVVISLVLCLAPLVMRFGASVTAGCHAVVSAIVMMIVGLSILGGGMTSPTVPALVMAPMVALFLSNRAGAYAWTGIVVAVVIVIAAIEGTGHEFVLYLDASLMPFIRASVYGALFLNALFFVMLYDTAKQSALDEVNAANQRISKMIVHVEATGAALSRSAAAFFGAERAGPTPEPNDKGLTQQMMATAEDGRELIARVAERIHGMISQYEQISRRINDLYEQSGAITTMVSTIDNVSDRLDLMALNIGIEAANAGPAGRNFRLLADDMRRLAERVITETREIKRVMRQVRKHTDAAMSASQAGQNLTDSGVMELDRMSKSFDNLYDLIERTAEASKKVTKDTEVQIEAIHELASATSSARSTSP
ncbi:MAG: methyl-accepting chemotaxis protein [Myxococcota bacterium]